MRNIIWMLTFLAGVVEAQNALGAQGVTILENTDGDTTVTLQRVAPLGAGLRAILAMYALQVGGGCELETEADKGLHCELTAALGVGPQCSAAQLALIRAWFKKSIPRMSGARSETYQNVQVPGSLEEICYHAPFTASIQETWDRIQVEQRGDLIIIDAVGSTYHHGTGGPFHYRSSYKVEDHSIVTVSHRKIPPRARKDDAR